MDWPPLLLFLEATLSCLLLEGVPLALFLLVFSRGVAGDESTLPPPRKSGAGTPFCEPPTGVMLCCFLSGRAEVVVTWEGEEAWVDSAAC